VAIFYSRKSASSFSRKQQWLANLAASRVNFYLGQVPLEGHTGRSRCHKIDAR
jgi:hypothetical protein